MLDVSMQADRGAGMQEEEMKAKAQPQPKYRKDYTPTPYLVDSISLDFSLGEESTTVVARSHVKPNHSGARPCHSFQ